MIHQSDVELAHASPEERGDFHAFVNVIGKEATQAIAAGKPLTQNAIRPQVLVRRGEVVTVWARASGIRIRTMARARDDGGDGELVAVETLTDRGTFFAGSAASARSRSMPGRRGPKCRRPASPAVWCSTSRMIHP